MSLEKGFIDAIKEATKSSQSAYDTLATVMRVNDGTAWVHIDGGVDETPAELTINAKKGDTVRMRVSGGRAYLIGNSTDPPASGLIVSGMGRKVQSVVDILQANKISANTGIFEHLIANDALIKILKADKLDVDVANMKQATIDNLKAGTAQVQGLDAVYANIDGANIGEAFIGNVFTKNAMIEGAIVTTLNAAGEIVAVKLNADYIDAHSIKVDRLILLGQDGLYYTLNTNGQTVEQLQTNENSLSGSIITAQSITASKVAVEDLAAFHATIAGLILEDGSIHTVGKTSAMSTVDGFFIGSADAAGALEDMSGDTILAENDDDFDTSSDYSDGIAIGNGTEYMRFVGGKMQINSDGLRVNADGDGKMVLFKSLDAVGDTYATMDEDSFDVRQTTTAGQIDTNNDPKLASFGREVTVGSRQNGSDVGNYSQVFGAQCIAQGAYSHAEGYGTEAGAEAAHAEGCGAKAWAAYSHAEGLECKTDYIWDIHDDPFEPYQELSFAGLYAHAEGYKTYTSYEGAHAEGGYTRAEGAGAHAEGGWSRAGAYFSHAQNLGTIAIGDAQTAIGKYNVANDTDYAFIIGGGTNDNNRKTILAVDWQGNIHIPSSSRLIADL